MWFYRWALVLMPPSLSPSCHCQDMLVAGRLGRLLQQQEGADQVWGAVEVVVDMTGEWAIKPRGHRFMGHLLLPVGQRSGICDFVHLNIIRRLKLNLDPLIPQSSTLLPTIEPYSFRIERNPHLAWNSCRYSYSYRFIGSGHSFCFFKQLCPPSVKHGFITNLKFLAKHKILTRIFFLSVFAAFVNAPPPPPIP